MTKYTLTYFNLPGRGEIIRLIFAAAGVDFEDKRIEMKDWPQEKNNVELPFGQLPTLAIDGVVYGQTLSISRHLAEKFGLAGKNEMEKLRADMIVHCIEDIILQMVKCMYEKDEARKAELHKKLHAEELPKMVNYLENIIKQNGGGNGFSVGNELTWADLAIFHFINFFLAMHKVDEKFIDGFPKMKALGERVAKLPKIAAWNAKHKTA